MRFFLEFAIAGVFIAASSAGHAQRAAQPPAASEQSGAMTVEERAEQLKAVVRNVTSPDRDLNIANFEQLMESGDARRIEIAIRTLVSSDDPVLRGLAMRGYVAVTRDLVLEVVLTQNEMKAVTAARSDPNGINTLQGQYHHLQALIALGFKFPLVFEVASVKDPRGKVATPGMNNSDFMSTYVVRGDRITFGMRTSASGYKCEFELAPKKDATIVGTITCPNTFLSPIVVAASMF